MFLTNVRTGFFDLLDFIDREMEEEERKSEFYSRKMKATTHLAIVRFNSLSPLSLSLSSIEEIAEKKDHFLYHPDVFHPLFIASNITNGQYRKLSGAGTDRLYKQNNAGSFSHFYISSKVSEKTSPHLLKCDVPNSLEEQPIRSEILRQFYEQVARVTSEKDYTGTAFFIDFQSIMSLKGDIEEKEEFIRNLVGEYRVQTDVDHTRLNASVYMLESIEFQAEAIFGIDLCGQPLDEVFAETVTLPFEVPTPEKPTLKSNRYVGATPGEDLPTLSFFEMILTRLLVVNINKQGTVPSSGYTFTFAERMPPPANIERKAQIVADKNGNMFINRFTIRDIRKEAAFVARVKEAYQRIYGTELIRNEEETMMYYYGTLRRIMDDWMVKQPKEHEGVLMKWAKGDQGAVGKRLLDGPYRNAQARVAAMPEKGATYWAMLDLLVLLESLAGSHLEQIRKVSFLTKSFRLQQLLTKEKWSREEVCFALGAVASIVVKGSRNRDSLSKTLLRQSRIQDIKAQISKRYESGFDEITHHAIVSQVMETLAAFPTDGKKGTMSSDEKFSYIAGFLSEQWKENQPTKTEEK